MKIKFRHWVVIRENPTLRTLTIYGTWFSEKAAEKAAELITDRFPDQQIFVAPIRESRATIARDQALQEGAPA